MLLPRLHHANSVTITGQATLTLAMCLVITKYCEVLNLTYIQSGLPIEIGQYKSVYTNRGNEMSAQMTADNPYSAPGAELGGGESELYTPSIFSFSGRLGRLRYLAYSMGSYLILMLVMIPMLGVSTFMGGEPDVSTTGMLIMVAVYVPAAVVWIMFAKRRLNDLNRSGWWFLLALVPIVNFLVSIYMLFFPGTDGDNNFGPAPTANTLGVQILAWMIPALFVVGIVAAIVIPQFAAAQ
jgi:uncharacterized membrane protein YhaH (DUF805 family)